MQTSGSLYGFGQRDQRRRRLLSDDLSGQNTRSDCRAWSEDAGPRKTENYGNAEFLDEQLRLLDLIPRRMLVVVLLFIAGAAAITGFVFAHAWMLDHSADGKPLIAAFDLASNASLANWFSSLLLLAASVAALLVYTVRRHRVDDYRGYFRIWIWAAVAWFFLATDQAAGLREVFRDLMVSLTGTKLLGDGTLWWVALYAIAFGAVGSRQLVDMRFNPLSITALLLGATAHGAIAAMRLDWFSPVTGYQTVMLLSGLEMTGNLLILSAMFLHARHVLMDAEGLLPIRNLRRDIDEDDDSDSLDPSHDAWIKIDPPHNSITHQPVLQRVTSPSSSAVSSTTFPQSPINRKLTKGEKKALKERLLRERREREQKSG